METIIYHLRYFGMNECILRSQVHADEIADMTKWKGGSFDFSSHLIRAFLWALLGEICLFIANVILVKLRKQTQ